MSNRTAAIKSPYANELMNIRHFNSIIELILIFCADLKLRVDFDGPIEESIGNWRLLPGIWSQAAAPPSAALVAAFCGQRCQLENNFESWEIIQLQLSRSRD